MPARTAACRRRFRRTKWSASPFPADGSNRRARPCRGDAPALLGLLLLQWVLDGFEGRKLDVVKLALDLLDLADVDVLDDLARVRINGDRPARAFPFYALHRI